MWEIVSNFVSFLENLNFTEINFEKRQLDTVPETDIYNVNYF